MLTGIAFETNKNPRKKSFVRLRQYTKYFTTSTYFLFYFIFIDL